MDIKATITHTRTIAGEYWYSVHAVCGNVRYHGFSKDRVYALVQALSYFGVPLRSN